MPLILGTNSIKDTGFDVSNSLRFNDGSSDHLKQTFSSSGNQRTFTISFWFKRGTVASGNIYTYQGEGNEIRSEFILISNTLKIVFNPTGSSWSSDMIVQESGSNFLFRDHSAWYHVVMAFDTTQGTAANRLKVYVNGDQKTMSAYPTENFDTGYNTDIEHAIGTYIHAGNTFFDGYLAEFCVIDGSQLAADQFGEFDSNSPTVWKPIDVSGLTFGTNGFYLQFKESGTSANASGLGADTSGNTHHFTVSNLTALDQSIDTCTNNFATFNPLDNTGTGAPTGSEGNLKLTGDAGTNNTWNSTIGLSAGKWYVEVKMLASNPDASLGFRSQTNTSGSHNNIYGFDANPDRKKINGANSGAAIGSTSQNDILGMALDLDNGKMFIHRNGTYLSSGDPANGTNPFIQTSDGMPTEGVIGGHIYNGSVEWNFGSPSFSISSGNQDANGFGNFEYAVPSGYFSLCTKNLAEFG